MFAGLARKDGRDGVPMRRRAHHNGVDRWVVEQPPEIGLDRRTLALQVLDPFRALFEESGIHVTDRGHLYFRQLGEAVQQSSAAASYAHTGNPETLIRTGLCLTCSGNSQAGSSQR